MTPDRRTVLTAAAAFTLVPRRVFAQAQVPIRVGQGGVPTLAAALGRAAGMTSPRIVLDPGTYREKPTVTVPNLTIAAAAPGATLVYDAAAEKVGPTGKWGTSGSATLTIQAPGVTLDGLTIANDHDYLAAKMQAVALKVDGVADRCRITRCTLDGWQDTLLLQARSHLDRCRITGCVDFVFGGAAAWIERTTVVNRFVPNSPGGFIAAPSTPAAQPFGLVFADCLLEREAGVPDGSIWLGRPWRAGGNMALLGYAAFIRTRMDRHIQREGWTAMGYRDPAGVPRLLQPEKARFFEARNTGPGSVANPRRRILSPAAYRALTKKAVLGDWAVSDS